MNPTIKVLLLAAFATPFIIGSLMQLYVFNTSVKIFSAVDRATSGGRYDRSNKIKGIDKVLNIKGKYGANKRFESLAHFNDIEAPREITFDANIDPRTLLKEGEALPEQDLLLIFMEARGLSYGKAECKRLIEEEVLAQCVVRYSRVRGRDKKKFKVGFRLGFVQKDQLGSFGKSGTVSYQEIESKLSKKLSLSSYTTQKAEAVRLDMLLKAKSECALIRERQGNCAITSISTGAIERQHRGNVEITTRIVYSFLDGKS